MIRAAHLSAVAGALLLGACATTRDTTSTTYVQDKSAPAGTATYSSSSTVYANPASATTSGTTATAPAAGGVVSGSTLNSGSNNGTSAGTASGSTASSLEPSTIDPNRNR